MPTDHVSQGIIYKLVRLIAWCCMLFNLLFGHNCFIYQLCELNYIFCSFGANNADGRCLCSYVCMSCESVYARLNKTIHFY